MRSRLLYLGLAAALFGGTVACDESLSSLTGPTPGLEPTFSSIQNLIFNGPSGISVGEPGQDRGIWQ